MKTWWLQVEEKGKNTRMYVHTLYITLCTCGAVGKSTEKSESE